MTFEVHAKKLGRIAFRADCAVAYTQDPDTWHDYLSQIRRWTLGYWQTVRLHGMHIGRFWTALALQIAELLSSSVVLLCMIPLVVFTAYSETLANVYGDPVVLGTVITGTLDLRYVLVGVLLPDLLLTVFAAVTLRRPGMLLLAPLFPFMRLVDAYVCLRSIPAAAGRASSTGRWVSPTRRKFPAPSPPPSHQGTPPHVHRDYRGCRIHRQPPHRPPARRRRHASAVLDDFSTGSRATSNSTLGDPRSAADRGLDPRPRAWSTRSSRDADRVFHLAAAVGVRRIIDAAAGRACGPTSTAPRTSWRRPWHGRRRAGAGLHQRDLRQEHRRRAARGLRPDPGLPAGKSRWTYAAAKGIDEAFAHAYWREYGLQVSIVRLFNTVGPAADRPLRHGRAQPGRPGAARRAADGVTATAGRPGASPTSATSCPRWCALAENPEADGQAFNLGGALEVSILRSGPAHHRADRQLPARSSWCPTSRPTARATRTCAAGCPTTPRPLQPWAFRRSPA